MPTLKARIGGAWVAVGGGSSASEVEIATDDPIGTNPSAELWYDTDAPAILTDDMRWNTAWGVVGVGSFPWGDGVSWSVGALTSPLVVTTIAGRRYRVSMVVRAVISGATAAVSMNLQRDGVTITDRYEQMIGNANHQQMDADFLITGTGTSNSYVIVVGGFTTGQPVGYSSGGHFYIEDVGPVSGVVPAMPPDTDARWNTAWGVVAKMSSSAGVTVGSGTAQVGTSVTFTPVVGRRYHVYGTTMAYSNVVGDIVSATLKQGSTNMQRAQLQTSTYGETLFAEVFHDAVAATAQAWSLWVTREVGTGTIIAYADPYALHQLTVEDVGPVGGAVPVPNPAPAWITPTLQNGWTFYSASNYTPLRYRLLGDMVQLRGAVTGGTSNYAVFSLPVGYRPPGVAQFVSPRGPSLTFMAMNYPNGDVVVVGGDTSNIHEFDYQFSVTA